MIKTDLLFCTFKALDILSRVSKDGDFILPLFPAKFWNHLVVFLSLPYVFNK